MNHLAKKRYTSNSDPPDTSLHGRGGCVFEFHFKKRVLPRSCKAATTATATATATTTTTRRENQFLTAVFELVFQTPNTEQQRAPTAHTLSTYVSFYLSTFVSLCGSVCTNNCSTHCALFQNSKNATYVQVQFNWGGKISSLCGKFVGQCISVRSLPAQKCNGARSVSFSLCLRFGCGS